MNSKLHKTHQKVSKACDRCRLKKAKCDGEAPCLRCQSDDAICMYGERKKTRIVYRQEYIEMLEQQHIWLVEGLRELYRRMVLGERWNDNRLSIDCNGYPLTHDLLVWLGIIDPTKEEKFETDAEVSVSDKWRNDLLPSDSKSALCRNIQAISSPDSHDSLLSPSLASVPNNPWTPNARYEKPTDCAEKTHIDPYNPRDPHYTANFNMNCFDEPEIESRLNPEILDLCF